MNRLRDKYGSDEKSNSAQHKLRSQYKTCMNDAAQEENLIRDALAKIHEIRNIRNERRIQVSSSVINRKEEKLQVIIIIYIPSNRHEMQVIKKQFDVEHR